MQARVMVWAVIMLAGTACADELPPAVNPPPISLHVKDATLQELAAALAEAVDRPLPAPAAQREGGGEGKRAFTLDVKKQPFWEVFQQLDRQRDLSLTDRPGENLVSGAAGAPGGVVAGGFYFLPVVLRRTRTVKPQLLKGDPAQAAAGRREVLELMYSVMLDPRIVMISAHPPRILEVLDDQGHPLLAKPQEFDLRSGWDRPTLCIDQTWNCQVTGKMGSKIASFKGEAWFEVGEGQLRKELGNLTEKPQTFEMAGQKLSCGVVAGEDGKPMVSLWRDLPKGGKVSDALPIQIKAEDKAGHVLWRFAATNQHIDHPSGPEVTHSPPLPGVSKLVLTAPAQGKVYTIPFEFKDLAIPQ